MSNSIIKKAFLFAGGDFWLRIRNRTPRILFWHGVDQRVNPDVEQEIFDVEVFQQQIAYLNKHYEIISIEEFENRLNANRFSNKEVVLTFDDGYANNLYVVAPILNKLHLPFTVFVSVEHVEKGLFFPTSVNRIITKGAGLQRISIPSKGLEFILSNEKERNQACDTISHLLKTLPVREVKTITNDLIGNVDSSTWEELKNRYKSVRPMTWDEVKKISDTGTTIGSHCMWHICCHEKQDEKELEFQISESKQQLEHHLGKKCNYFAYPNGDYTDFSNTCVLSNYKLGFSTKGSVFITNDNHAIVPRIGVPGNMDTFRIITNLFPNKK